MMKYQYSDSHPEDNHPLPTITYSLIRLPLPTFKDEKNKVIKIVTHKILGPQCESLLTPSHSSPPFWWINLFFYFLLYCDVNAQRKLCQVSSKPSRSLWDSDENYLKKEMGGLGAPLYSPTILSSLPFPCSTKHHLVWVEKEKRAHIFTSESAHQTQVPALRKDMEFLLNFPIKLEGWQTLLGPGWLARPCRSSRPPPGKGSSDNAYKRENVPVWRAKFPCWW